MPFQGKLLRVLVALLTLLSGCAQVDTLRLVQDRPEDLDSLLSNNEYARARLLTGRFPAIDDSETQMRITSGESTFENGVYHQARDLEKDQDLLAASNLLTDALQKVPHSVLLRELRNDIEQERQQQIAINRRNQLLARADYLIDQQTLYQQRASLKKPGFTEQYEHKRMQTEAVTLAGDLLAIADQAAQNKDIDTARECLQRSLQLNNTEAAAEKLAALEKDNRQAGNRTRSPENEAATRSRRNSNPDDHQETRQLLDATRQAMDKNALQDARASLARIPESNSQDSEVKAAQEDLQEVISERVNKLLMDGDAQYRAEKILPALQTWTRALSLDPDNPDVRERIERANKVLARFEELKRQQQK